MRITTRAIVLRTVPHRDKLVVLKVYTEAHGLRGYLVRNGGRGGMAPALHQPLNRLELVADERADRDLMHLHEARVESPFRSAHADPVKATVLLFMQELLYRTLKEEVHDAELFAFLHHALEVLDQSVEVAAFPLLFLLNYGRFLGFHPEPPRSGHDHFDLQEGEFVPPASGGHVMGPPHSSDLAMLLDQPMDAAAHLKLPAARRRALLDRLLLYYQLHIESLGQLRSPAVLHQVLG